MRVVSALQNLFQILWVPICTLRPPIQAQNQAPPPKKNIKKPILFTREATQTDIRMDGQGIIEL